MNIKKSHLSNQEITRIVNRDIDPGKAFHLFQHWQNCRKCYDKIKGQKINNPIYKKSISQKFENYRCQIGLKEFHFDIMFSNEGIRRIQFINDQDIKLKDNNDCSASIIKNFRKHFETYLNQIPEPFNKIDPSLIITKFQKEVLFWTSLIPYGSSVNYGKIGKWMNKNCAQAVGQALNKNPLPIIIPCHRVIGKDGSLTGFASGVKLKKKLLEIEKSNRNH
ncbi:MAG TPA: methylated-DNA--[protein]-cysteine S-methyltransferase [bacterium]|nr:methylated-DNA--[protein]-cysteine S-methyltransferase [bacterium]